MMRDVQQIATPPCVLTGLPWSWCSLLYWNFGVLHVRFEMCFCENKERYTLLFSEVFNLLLNISCFFHFWFWIPGCIPLTLSLSRNVVVNFLRGGSEVLLFSCWVLFWCVSSGWGLFLGSGGSSFEFCLSAVEGVAGTVRSLTPFVLSSGLLWDSPGAGLKKKSDERTGSAKRLPLVWTLCAVCYMLGSDCRLWRCYC